MWSTVVRTSRRAVAGKMLPGSSTATASPLSSVQWASSKSSSPPKPPSSSSSAANKSSKSAPPPPPPPPPPAASHRPPLNLYGLAARYANATYVAASKAGVLDQVEQELLALHQVITTTSVLDQFMHNPLIRRADKVAKIETMRSRFSPTTIQLLITLAGNARLSELPKIITLYSQLIKARRGHVEAIIITADPLTKAQEDDIAAAIMKVYPGTSATKTAKVVVSSQVDPSILGGLQVKIGDQFLDLSVKSRIAELAQTPV